MAAPSPDVTGFMEAQARLRSQLGQEVTFKVPVAKVWPEGTKLNPDTGLPYDSTIVQTSAEFTEVVKTCLVVLKQASPLRPQADVHYEPVGEMSGMDIILNVAEIDKADVEGATEFTVNGLTYRVEEFKPFAIAGQPYRWLIYGAEL